VNLQKKELCVVSKLGIIQCIVDVSIIFWKNMVKNEQMMHNSAQCMTVFESDNTETRVCDFISFKTLFPSPTTINIGLFLVILDKYLIHKSIFMNMCMPIYILCNF